MGEHDEDLAAVENEEVAFLWVCVHFYVETEHILNVDFASETETDEDDVFES